MLFVVPAADRSCVAIIGEGFAGWSDDMDDLPLSEALDSLRDELMRAVDRAGGSWLRFAVKSIELELHVVAVTSGEVRVGSGLWRVVTVGGAATRSSEAMHRIALTLEPRAGSEGESAEVLVGEDGAWRPQ
jgi:hypothetical protein